MKKKFNAKPITEVELCFEDGKVLNLLFSTKAFYKLHELEGGYKEFMQSNPSEMCARIIYSTCTDDNFTIEEARMVTSNLSPSTVAEIINEYINNMYTEDEKKQLKKLTMQYLGSTNMR